MRIAIVNDMLLAVEAMRRAVISSGEHRVAWVARDGEEAVQLARNDRPDLVLMDLVMPRMSGVEATRLIMAQAPCPILVVTANMNENPGLVFEAMGEGALDAVATPVLGRAGDSDGTRGLLAKIEAIRRLTGDTSSRTGANGPAPAESKRDQLVAIGASAGGPAAVAKVLGGLPADFPAAIVVVQHVDVQFARGLADWLGLHTRLKVQLANEGDEVRAGHVFLAGREHHLARTSSDT
jgi:chemotaxis response regulator CheB